MKEILEQLRASVLVYGNEDIQDNLHQGFTPAHFESLRKRVGDRFEKLPTNFLAGFDFQWSWSDPDWEGLNASGQINCPGVIQWINGEPSILLKPYGEGYEGLLWSKEMQNGWKGQFENFLLLDYLGLGNAVLMDTETGSLVLWLFNLGALPLALDPESYFDEAIKFRGLYLWQKYFLADSFALPAGLISISFLQLQRLFPELSQYETETIAPNYLLIAQQKKYISKFDPLYDRLRSKGAKIRESLSNYGTHLSVVNRIFQSHGVSFQDELLAFFVSVGTVHFDWEVELQNGQKAGGEFFLYGLDDMFGGPEDQRSRNVNWDYCTFKQMNFGKDEAKDPEYKPFFEKRTLYWDPNCQILLCAENGKLRLELMHDVDELYDFDIPFEVIIDRLFDCAGMQSWPFQIRPEKPPLRLVPFKEPLSKVFPEVGSNGFYFHS